MASRSPSVLALLGLAAVAGYQNRDRLGEIFRDLSVPSDRTRKDGNAANIAYILRNLGLGPSEGQQTEQTAGGGLAGILARGMNELVEAFREPAPEVPSVADSWVSRKPNQPVDERTLELAIGDAMLHDLTQRTGLNRGEILKRLVAVLPDAIDEMTPEGRVPVQEEATALPEPQMMGKMRKAG